MPTELQQDNYTIERLSRDRLKDLEQLYEAVYHKKTADNYFARKYDTAYTGVEYIGYLAYSMEGNVVAYYGVMPCMIEYEGAIILAAQSGDTMTDPSYRFKGMFVELSKITFELCRQNGIRFIFGFPNQHSYHGAVQKLGWQLTEHMDCFIIPIVSNPLISLFRKFRPLGAIYSRYANRVLGRLKVSGNGIPNSVIADGHAGIHRNENYLNYRRYSKTMVINAGKAKAWIKLNDNFVLGDLLLNGQDADVTIGILRKTAAKLGLQKLLFHSSPGPSLHGLLQDRYPSIPSFPVLFQDFGSGIRFDKIKFSFADIDIF